jgi:hypothetical protein
MGISLFRLIIGQFPRVLYVHKCMCKYENIYIVRKRVAIIANVLLVHFVRIRIELYSNNNSIE